MLADIKANGADKVWSIVEQRWRGLRRLRQRVGDERLGFKAFGGYELFRPKDQQLYEECLDAIPGFNKELQGILGIGEYFQVVDEQIKQFSFNKIDHLLLNKAEGQINTGKMMKSLLALVREQQIEIYNGISVHEIADSGESVRLQSDQGWEIKCQRVLVATNGFAATLLPDIQVRPARNQVLITKPIKDLKIKGTFHYDQGYYYFRNIDNRLLFGGGRNLALEEESTHKFGTTDKIQEALIKLLEEVILPETEFEIDSWWSGILGVGNEKSPIIEKVSSNVVVAVRLGGMGVALGSLVGEEGAGLLVD